MTSGQFSIGVDIGGGSTKIGLISSNGNLVDIRRVAMKSDQGTDEIIAAYIAAIEGMTVDRPLPIGVAYPGHVDHETKSGLNSNVPALDGKPLCEILGHHFGGPTALLNDADAAAYAESLRHQEGLTGRLLLVTLGTGIGVAMTVKGQALVIAGGTLGDPGHLSLDPSGKYRCRQGCAGCLESLASAEAIEREASEFAAANPESALAQAMDVSGVVAASEVCRLALANDPDANGLVGRVEDWLAMAVASWRAVYHPDLICFGGGLSVLGKAFVERIHAKADARSLPFVSNNRLALALLGNDAGMIGAGMKALHTSQLQDMTHV